MAAEGNLPEPIANTSDGDRRRAKAVGISRMRRTWAAKMNTPLTNPRYVRSCSVVRRRGGPVNRLVNGGHARHPPAAGVNPSGFQGTGWGSAEFPDRSPVVDAPKFARIRGDTVRPTEGGGGNAS